ncbi:hypothetical protein ACIXIR_14050 [Bacteroides fragilis]
MQRKTHDIYQIKSIVQNLDIAIKANREVEIDKDIGEQNHHIRLSINSQKIKIVYKPASYKTIASVIKEKTG